VVIFSCVRAHSRRSGVGFLSDVRRMNVGLTRARRALWILGHSSTLQVPGSNDGGKLLVFLAPDLTCRRVFRSPVCVAAQVTCLRL